MASIHSIAANPSIRIYQPVAGPVENGAAAAFKRASRFLRDTYEGLSSSRVLRAIVCGGAAFGAVTVTGLVLAYLGLTPPGWITTAVIVAGAALYGFFSGGSCSLKGKDIIQEMGCELGAIKRLFNAEYNEITWKGKRAPGRILLGPMPNQINHAPEKIAKREHLSAVLSINAPGPVDIKGERGCYGLMHAPTPKDWLEQDVTYGEIDLPDHIPLPIEKLDAAADYINFFVKNGQNIYVHCKAGKSRSAMAIAAYMIKYGHLSTDKAVSIIRECRSIVHVHEEKRVARLREYQAFCANRPNVESPQYSAPLRDFPARCCLFC